MSGRGQGSLISVTLLVSAALILGIALASYANSVLSEANLKREKNNLPQKETSITIIYDEYDDNDSVYLGVIRIDGSPGLYYYLVVNGSGTSCSDLDIFEGVASSTGVPAYDVYLMDEQGGHFPISILVGQDAKVPLHAFSVPAGGKPYLIKVTFDPETTCKCVVFFTKIGDEYYEVGRFVSS